MAAAFTSQRFPPSGCADRDYPLQVCAGCRSRAPKGVNFSRCSRCSLVIYCGTKCQTDAWPTHKKACKIAKKWKEEELAARGDDETGSAIILKGPAKGEKEDCSLDGLVARMEFFKFNDLGSELGEVEQLKSEIGWKSPFEGGKFYPEVGFAWYFFMYHDEAVNRKPAGTPRNRGAAYGSYSGQTFGDVVITKSSPAHIRASKSFTKKETAKALLFNQRANREQHLISSGLNPRGKIRMATCGTGSSEVFQEREMRRTMGGLAQGSPGPMSGLFG